MSVGLAGHVFDMINRMKNNRALLKEQKIKYNKVKEAHQKITSHFPEFKDRSKLNEKELEALKRKIRFEVIKDEHRAIIFTIIISFILVVSAVFYVVGKYNLF